MNEAMRAAQRTLALTGSITFPTGVSATLEDILCAIIEEGADGALTPGAVLSAQYTVEIANDKGQWRTEQAIVGSTVQLFLNGDPLGVFQVNAVCAQERSGKIALSGNDSVASELSGTFVDSLSYPATLQEVWMHGISQTRYTWSGVVPNGESIIDSAPEWGNISLRGALGRIAQAAGCFVRVNRLGALELVKCAGDVFDVLNADDYFALEEGFDAFGPVEAVSIVPVGAETAIRYGSQTGDALQIRDNPLFIAESPHLNALAEGLLETLSTLSWTRCALTWRGDPAIQIGARICILDTGGKKRECLVSRQTLRFEKGFSSVIECAIPNSDSSGVPRAITPEGGVNADRLIGRVDGGLLRAGTVVSRALAAGSVTAEKLAAGSVCAESIQAGAVTADKIASGALTAEEIRAVTAHLEDVVSRETVTDKLYAALIRAHLMAVKHITAQNIQTDALGAALAEFVELTARVGKFDLAAAENLLSGALILKSGVADSMTIENLAVTGANLLNATVDRLILKGEDGLYYRICIGSNGVVSSETVEVAADEAKQGETADGRRIVETSANIVALNAQTVRAQEAVLSAIFTECLTAGKITAGEAVLASASVPALCVASMKALGNGIDISANEAIAMTVQSVDAVSEAAETATTRAENALKEISEAQEKMEALQSGFDEMQLNNTQIQNQLALTKEGLRVVQSAEMDLDGRIRTIESGVHMRGAAVEIYTSESAYRNILTNDGWRITENGAAVIACAETKLTAPRVQVTDALILGGIAMKTGADGHTRMLKYNA